VEKTTVPLTN